MIRDEKGYIQFQCAWHDAAPPNDPLVADLLRWRERLHGLGLIGVYPDGIGYGNISVKPAAGIGFLISGTATGGLPTLTPQHVTEVVSFDIADNRLACRGPVKASSESLSHAAVYGVCDAVRAVIHVHHLGIWERLRHVAPTTDDRAEAGTPEMAWAIEALFRSAAPPDGFFVMGGHREGLMAYGKSLNDAGDRLVAVFEEHRRVTPS